MSSAIAASFTYLAADSPPPFAYAFPPPPGQAERGGTYVPVTMPVADARPLGDALSLDREGFVLRRHPTALTSFADDAAVKAVYYPEMAALMGTATGATRVLVFDHTRRLAGAQPPPGTREAVLRVHNDYTMRSAPQRVRDLLPAAQAERLLGQRWALVNAWRPLKRPVPRTPLAFCDATTTQAGDFVAAALIYTDRRGETASVVHSPRHRWYHFPDMTPDEVALFKCFDSDAGRARMTPHSAFEDPATPASAPLRESIEVRALLFFAPEWAEAAAA
jgi:hypothetical protein